MDPLTQGVLGVSASQLVSRRHEKFAAAVLGFFSGMAADLDVLISSETDPLLFLEYHRHFTHALIFIPFGALLCALLFHFFSCRWFKRHTLSFAKTYLFCLAGYATHAVLDACTTYGTQLLWPFSDARIAWNNVSVIDPLFTIPLLTLVAIAVFRRSNNAAVAGAVYAITYLDLGLWQQQRAEDAAIQLALSRGHQPINLGVKPSMANIIVWKSVYQYQNRYYVDAVRVLGTPSVYEGTSTDALNLETHFPWLEADTQQARDIQRFAWFSNQHLGMDPNDASRIIDIRYSLVPNEVTGMWGIELARDADKNEHVDWTVKRPEGEAAFTKLGQLWSMVLGR